MSLAHLTSDKTDKSAYYTPAQVALHNSPEDLWLSFLGHVYNLSSLAADYAADPLLGPILCAAGTDISHWFDPTTGDVKSHVNPMTGCLAPYTPNGRFLHGILMMCLIMPLSSLFDIVPPPLPRSDWNPCELTQTPWWFDYATYKVGFLSKSTRNVIVVNTLTQQSCTIRVCGEETMLAIQDRYLVFNCHAKGYMWRFF